MPQFVIDPRDTIDRKAEQEQFTRHLISFAPNEPARMLVIRDKAGLGKSTLLRRLHYTCRFQINPPIPASLVDLGQLASPSPFAFVEKVVEGLGTDDRFPNFIALNNARGVKNFAPFDTTGADAFGAVMGREKIGTGGGAIVLGNVISGGDVVMRDKHVHGDEVNITVLPDTRTEFNDAQEQIARKKCIDAFLGDLRASCASQAMVILLDHWEKCSYDLREWIRNTLLRQHCFSPSKDLRPDKLAIVVAGDTYDPAKVAFGIREREFEDLFGDSEAYSNTVLSIESLSKWEEEHVKAFLRLHGYVEAEDMDIHFLRERLLKGNTLDEILNAYMSIHPQRP